MGITTDRRHKRRTIPEILIGWCLLRNAENGVRHFKDARHTLWREYIFLWSFDVDVERRNGFCAWEPAITAWMDLRFLEVFGRSECSDTCRIECTNAMPPQCWGYQLNWTESWIPRAVSAGAQRNAGTSWVRKSYGGTGSFWALEGSVDFCGKFQRLWIFLLSWNFRRFRGFRRYSYTVTTVVWNSE